MTLYVVIREHNYGADAYLVKSNHFPTDDEIVETLSLDYEPERGEELTVASSFPEGKDVPEVKDVTPILSYPAHLQTNQRTNQQKFEDAVDIIELTPYDLLPIELQEKIAIEIIDGTI